MKNAYKKPGFEIISFETESIATDVDDIISANPGVDYDDEWGGD